MQRSIFLTGSNVKQKAITCVQMALYVKFWITMNEHC